jgi:hypothetical protein
VVGAGGLSPRYDDAERALLDPRLIKAGLADDLRRISVR